MVSELTFQDLAKQLLELYHNPDRNLMDFVRVLAQLAKAIYPLIDPDSRIPIGDNIDSEDDEIAVAVLQEMASADPDVKSLGPIPAFLLKWVLAKLVEALLKAKESA